MVAEPKRFNCHVPPPGLWAEVRALCAKLVFDEIPSDLAKTGRFFTFENFDAVPNSVVLGKSLGGGIVPIAAVIADTRLNVAPELNLGRHTHEKNPLTWRATLETLHIIEDEGLIGRGETMGAMVYAAVKAATGLTPRGLGLLLALPLEGTWVGRAEVLVARLRPIGLFCTAKGRDAIGLSPPLVISAGEIALAAGTLRETPDA